MLEKDASSLQALLLESTSALHYSMVFTSLI